MGFSLGKRSGSGWIFGPDYGVPGRLVAGFISLSLSRRRQRVVAARAKPYPTTQPLVDGGGEDLIKGMRT